MQTARLRGFLLLYALAALRPMLPEHAAVPRRGRRDRGLAGARAGHGAGWTTPSPSSWPNARVW
ncbi:MAG: hypothetical protein WDM92_08185 [Caulobacteraceae bacterium]